MNVVMIQVESWRSMLVVCFLLFLELVSCSPESGGGIAGHVACKPVKAESQVTVATYNIHAGVGRDGKRDLKRIAETLKGADVAGLQEVDNGRIRSGFENQAQSLAAALGHRYWQHFAAEDYWPFGTYGTAASSSLPVVASGIFDLPIVEGKPTRRLAWIKFLADCRSLHVFLVHLTRTDHTGSPARTLQVHAMWQMISDKTKTAGEPVILMGDFNAGLSSQAIQWLRQRMIDVVESHAPQLSALAPLDHIFVTGDLLVRKAEVRDNGASDHPAVVVTFQWK